MDQISQRAAELKQTMACCVCYQDLAPNYGMLRCCQQILCPECFGSLTSDPKRCPMCNLRLTPPSLAHPDLFESLNALLGAIDLGRPTETFIIDGTMLRDVLPDLADHVLDHAEVFFSGKEVEFLCLLTELKRGCAGHLVQNGRLDGAGFGAIMYRLIVSTHWRFAQVKEFASFCAKFGVNRQFISAAALPEAYQLPADVRRNKDEVTKLILSWVDPFVPSRYEVVDSLAGGFGLQSLVGHAHRHDWGRCLCVQCSVKSALRNEKVHLDQLQQERTTGVVAYTIPCTYCAQQVIYTEITQHLLESHPIDVAGVTHPLVGRGLWQNRMRWNVHYAPALQWITLWPTKGELPLLF